MKKHYKKRLVFNFIVTFVGFFLFAGFFNSVSIALFALSSDIKYEIFRETTPIAIFSLILFSALFGIIGTIWRRLTVEKPLNEINEALIRITKGDLSTKLKRRKFTSRYSTIVNNINVMTSELTSIDNMKVTLMSNISHELKTPISVINNYATLLQNPKLPHDKQLEYAKAISVSSAKMNELIMNILKLNQLENQKIPSELISFDLSEQICECLLAFEDTWESKKIEINTDIDDSVNVTSDKQLLTIVWNNLLSNAFKFTPDGGSISVSVKKHKKYASVEITDSGCGIPEEKLQMIFEKFYQCDSSRGTEGNGLGLALVKRIVNILNCYIDVHSTFGEGSIFTVKIPIE